MSDNKDLSNMKTKITCNTCGIDFVFPENIRLKWVESGKEFKCPNDHGLSYKKTTQEALTVEIKGLKEKLKIFKETISSLETKIKDLELELEIYKPVSIAV